jgi:hypothetical protein
LDCDHYTTFSSTIQDITIRLLMVIAAQNNLHTMTTDVANAFCGQLLGKSSVIVQVPK